MSRPADLDDALVEDRPGRAQLDLELLGGLGAGGEAVLVRRCSATASSRS